MRIVLFLSIIAMVFSAAFLFLIKHEVVILEREILRTSLQISQTEQETETLKSELSYLTNPQRIYELVQHHFIKLRPLNRNQLVPHSYLKD
jgi:cell division protein FtsL